MSNLRKIKQRTKRRQLRTRRKVKNSLLPRISVFRSLNHIYAQLIDDQKQATLVSCSSFLLKDLKGTKTEKAKAVGAELARLALEKGIKKACFDRGRCLYHGRVKALSEGISEGGLSV